MNINLESLYTPYTLDGYQTFDLERETDMLIEDECEKAGEELEYDDFDWHYNFKNYLEALAKNYIKLLNQEILDDIILSVKSDCAVISPSYYNYTTDKIYVDFEINKKKLDKFIEENFKDYEKDRIKSNDGFIWLADEDDDETKLEYYLRKVSEKKYSRENYMMDQMEIVQGWEYVTCKLIKK